MNCGRIISLVFLGLTGIALVFSHRFAACADADRTHAAAMARAIEDLRKMRHRCREAIAAVEVTQAKLNASLVSARAAPATPKPKSESKYFEQLRTNPTVQAQYLEYERAGVAIEYGSLMHRLHLDAERAQAFTANVAHNRAAQLDLRSALLAKGLTYDDEAAQTLLRQIQEDYLKQQRTLLGDDAFAEFTAYERQLPARKMVDAIAGHALVSGIEFTGTQLEQLTTVVAEVRKSGGGNMDWSQVDERAKAFLTPEQLRFIQTHEALGPMGSGWRFQNRLNDLISEADRKDRQAREP